MHDIAQSNSLNPSVASDCRWNVGFPVLGNISIAAKTPLTYNDLGRGKESIDGQKIASQLKNTNILSSNVSLNILTLGYRAGDMYYQFTMNEKVFLRGSSSKIPVDLLMGNAPSAGKTYEINIALSMAIYREYGLNVAYNFGDDLWLGARAKLLFGRVGAHSPNDIVSLYTDPLTQSMDLKSDLLMKASIPGTIVVDPGSGTISKFNSQLGVKHFIFNPVNIGGAIDLGVNKFFENGWKFSASILNIGMINWRKHTHQFYQKSTLNYNMSSSGIIEWDDFVDTVKSVIKNSQYTGHEAFPQWLSPEIMIGASYPVMEYLRVGVTGYSAISSSGIPWAITATALTDNTSHVYGALSYTVTNNSFLNIGAGVGFRFGAFNIHAITDNIMMLFKPATQKYATVQLGINFKFGCGEEDKKLKYKSVPCPSFGHSSRKMTGSVPCSSGKRK
jgi:hypothetical protein